MSNLNPTPPGFETRFQPGRPSPGRPKDLVREYGKRKIHKNLKTTEAQAVVEAAFYKAKKGDSKVIPYLLDRLFGKMTQPVEITGLEGLAERIARARGKLEPEPARPVVTESVTVLQLPAKSNETVIEAEAVEAQVIEEVGSCDD